jgi:hypothetical protein
MIQQEARVYYLGNSDCQEELQLNSPYVEYFPCIELTLWGRIIYLGGCHLIWMFRVPA